MPTTTGERYAEDALGPELTASAALAAFHAALPVVAFVAFYLAAYPAFIRFSPHGLAALAVPYHLGKQLEFPIYAVTFACLLPISIWTSRRHVQALTRLGIDAGFVAVLDVALLTATLVAARIAISYAPPISDPSRASWIRATCVFLLVVVIALVVANVSLVRYPKLRPRVALGDRVAPLLMVVAGVLTAALLPKSVFRPEHGLAALGVGLVLFGAWRFTARREAPRRLRRAVDVLSVVLIALLAWDVRLPSPHNLQVLAYNHDVYLGPVNTVLHGGTVLVDVNPHYGPVLTYFLAGLFHLFPIGYGTFWLVSVAFDVLLFIGMYGVMRVAGVGRVLAICGIVTVVLTCEFSQGAIGTEFTMNPSRSLRLFLPVFAILAIQLVDRYPGHSAALSWGLAAVVGLSSVWAIEVFFYTAVGVVSALACRSWLDARDGARFAFDRRIVARILAAVVLAQLVFTGATRIFSGSWPNWVRYVQYDRAYSTGSVGQRYHWAPFAPGTLLGLFYFVTVSATIIVLVWNRRFARNKRHLLIAACGVEGFAVAYFSYFAGVSELGTLNKMGPVAILLVVIVLALLADGTSVTSTAIRVGVTVLAVSCAATYLIAQPRWPTNLSHSALFAGPRATIDDVRTEASRPVVFPTTPAAVALLRRAVGTGNRALVLMPDVQTTEVLMRAGKRQAILPYSDPYGDKQLSQNVVRFKRLAAELPVGTPFLSEADYFRTSAVSAGADIDAALIEELKRDFAIRAVAAGPYGLRVYSLATRR